MNARLPDGWDAGGPDDVDPGDGKVATRKASGRGDPVGGEAGADLISGSADLEPSTLTNRGRRLSRPVTTPAATSTTGWRARKGAIVNGLVLHGFRAFGSTFFNFLDYMKPAVRLASLMHIPTVHVYTHDSIGLGEDGPTHQPVEQLATLRAQPNIYAVRPADATRPRSPGVRAQADGDADRARAHPPGAPIQSPTTSRTTRHDRARTCSATRRTGSRT